MVKARPRRVEALGLLSGRKLQATINLKAMDMDTTKSERVTLTDDELLKACRDWISKLCKNPNSWSLHIPVDFNRDTDMLFSVLCTRFKKAKANAPDKQHEATPKTIKLPNPGGMLCPKLRIVALQT